MSIDQDIGRISDKVDELDKHTAKLYNSLNNSDKLYDKMSDTLETVSEMTHKLDKVISLHEQSITDLKHSSNVQSKSNEDIILQLSTLNQKMHENHITQLEFNNNNREYTNVKVGEISLSVSNTLKETRHEIEEKVEKTIEGTSSKIDSIGTRLNKVENFQLKVATIATIIPIGITLLPKVFSWFNGVPA